MEIKFKINKMLDELSYNPPKESHNFYQLCMYIDKKINKYHVRKCHVNQYGELENSEVKYITQKQYDRFTKIHKDNEYKLYPTYNINYVDFPNPGELFQAKSGLLNDNYDISGYAPF